MFSLQSNHEHLIIYDRLGRCTEFIELIARSQNALRGRWQNLWSSEEACVVRLVNREDVIAKMIYTAANPVKDRLVDRVQWPGANCYVNLLNARPFTATRPTHFFHDTGPLPATVTFSLSIPEKAWAQAPPSSPMFLTFQAAYRAARTKWLERRTPSSRPAPTGCAASLPFRSTAEHLLPRDARFVRCARPSVEALLRIPDPHPGAPSTDPAERSRSSPVRIAQRISHLRNDPRSVSGGLRRRTSSMARRLELRNQGAQELMIGRLENSRALSNRESNQSSPGHQIYDKWTSTISALREESVFLAKPRAEGPPNTG